MYDISYKKQKEVDMEELKCITHFFKSNKVRIVKLNHCLAEDGYTEFDSLMQLSSDG